MIRSFDQKNLFSEEKFFGPFSVRYLINLSHHLNLSLSLHLLFFFQQNAIVSIEIETKVVINRTMNIITISISINEKMKSILAESTIWNLNQYHSSNSRTSNILRTSNFDSIKEKLMKTDKYFNYNESDYLNRDCSKSRKFRIVEMNVRNDTKNSKKE